MSAKKSRLRKILRQREREHKRYESARERYRKPGETDEQMEARMKRDLTGWLDMMEEREVEEVLTAEAERLKTIENLQTTDDQEEKL